MIQIDEIDNKYRIKFSDPETGVKSTCRANDFSELKKVLEHHLVRSDRLHIHRKIPDCPLCRREKARVNSFKGVQRFAESKGLILEKRIQFEDGRVAQRYEIHDNDKGVTAGVLTLTEAVQEIGNWD